MPVVSRARLRQQVGLTKIRDTIVSTTVFSPNLGVGSAVMVMASRLANVALSGQALGQNFHLRIFADDYHVASYNVGSGAYVSGQTAATTVGSGAPFEVHRKVPSDEKDRAIDGIIGRLWTRQELPIDTVAGLLQYSVGLGFKVFGAYYFAAPSSSLNRQPKDLPPGWNMVLTGSGRELRLPEGTALSASQQIIIDAQIRATLGAADTATVNIPDEDWVLNGVAARCYQSLWADAPGKEAGKYSDLAKAYGAEFIKGIGRFRDSVDIDWRGAFDGTVT